MRDHRLFRPPAEADSLVIRVADGCPHNQCTFCGMYKGVRFRAHQSEEIARSIADAKDTWPGARRIFLADGDVMALSFDRLRTILTELAAAFPYLIRVSVYANGSSIARKTEAELNELRRLKLQTLYLGLESGWEDLLVGVKKGETAAQMIAAVRRAQDLGFRVSVMVLIGLAGRTGSRRHARETAAALNRMQPRLLSALRCIPIPGTGFFDQIEAGNLEPLTEWEAVGELRELASELQLERTVFRANHRSNVVPIEARFPRDRQALLSLLDQLLTSKALDRTSPGEMPYVL